MTQTSPTATISLRSSLNAVNMIMPSGYLTGIPYNFFGKYMAGKSLLTLQEAVYLCSQISKGKEKANVLVFDVDGGYDLFLREWGEVFSARWDYGGQIYVVPAYNVQRFSQTQKHPYFDLPIYEYFGVKSQVTLSQKGKANFSAYEPCTGIVSDYVTKKDVRVIVVDSFSQIFKDVFQGTESFGERARAEDFLFGLIKSFMLKHRNVYTFLNHHQSVNPITGETKIAGGSSVLQNSKVALFLSKNDEKQPVGEIWLYRYPNVPPFSRHAQIAYSELGIVDAGTASQ